MGSSKVVCGALLVTASLGLPLFGARETARATETVPTREEAARRLAAVPDGDALAAFRLALELESTGGPDVARPAYERLVAADPDHLAARRALGYERIDGRWLTGDELRRAKGVPRGDARPRPPTEGERPAGARAPAAARREPDAALARLRRAAAALRGASRADRVRAAEDLARLGDRRGVAVLVAAWGARRGPASGATDGYFAQELRTSYLGDFDVEVA
jgi:hypothetical protein